MAKTYIQKPIKVENVEGEYSIFRNEDGTYDIVNEQREIEKFEKPSNSKVQKNVINAFKESKLQKKNPVESKKFKDDFLSDDSNLNQIYLPNVQNKKNAAKNLRDYREGKTDKLTVQAKALDNYLNQSINDGQLRVIPISAGGKSVKNEYVPLNSIFKKENPITKGKVIYSTSGTGKTTLAKEQSDKYVDADVLIANEFKRMANNKEFDTLPNEIVEKIKKLNPDSKTFAEDISAVFSAEFAQGKTYNNTTSKEAYDNVRKSFKQITDSGKDILTGSSTFLDVADEVYTEEKEVVEKRKNKDLKVLKQREEERIKKFGKTPVKLEGKRIDEARSEKPKKKIDLAKKEKEVIDAFKNTKLKNIENAIDKEIEKQENKRKDNAGKLQSGIPFVDRNTYIIFLKGIKALVKTAKSFNELISKLKKWIADNGEYSQEKLDEIYNEIDAMISNKNEIMQQLKEMYKSEKPHYEAPESLNSTIEEKVNAHRKAFSSLFKNVAENHGHDKNILEKKFFSIVQSGLFDNIKNEAEYIEALNKAKNENFKYEQLFEEMELLWDYPRAISLLNFYRSVRLIEQYGVVFSKKGDVKIKSLNSEDFTNDLSNMFKKHINNMFFRTNDDTIIDDANKAINAILIDYRSKIDDIRKKSNSEKKIEEFDAQLDFLQKLTGIDKTIWEDYFSPVTKETSVLLKKVDDKGNERYEKVVFKDYRSLLKYDSESLNDGVYKDVGIISGTKLPGTYVGSAVYYDIDKIKKAPAIINSLTKRIDRATLSNKKNVVIEFMTKGDKEKNVYSNIKKLASSIKGAGNISTEGVDVQGNRFNSFVLMSHLQNAAENIHKSNIDNDIANMYKEKNSPMKISILNGIANERNDKKLKSDKMTESEYWLSQMVLFQNSSEGTYKGALGQFGDKKTFYIADVKHYERTNIKAIENEFNDLDSVREFLSKIIIKGIRNGMFSGMKKSERDAFVDDFIYNFARNAKDILEIFHGSEESYINKKTGKFSLTDVVKRAASTNSTGYQLDTSVENGVGKTFKFVSALDNIDSDELGLSEEQFDGILFYSGKMGEKLSVSMGDMYNKRNEYDGPLSSVKALFSTQKNTKRGLTKTNWVNIDVIAEAYKNNTEHYSHQIKKFIDKNEIDVLSFDSGTKKLEDKEHIVLFDKDGKIRDVSADELSNHMFERNTSDIYVQQDLRHTSELDRGKQSTQLMANILALQHAPEMVSEMNNQVRKILELLESKLSQIDNTQDKLDFLSEQLETQDQAELSELISLGVTLHDAGYKNMMQSILSSYFTKKGLQKLSNRVATQELPADKTLKGYRIKGEEEKEIIQDNNSYYRGQFEQPKIDSEGDLVLFGVKDRLYEKAGLKSIGISMTDNLRSAIEYGEGQLETRKNLAIDEYSSDQELEELDENGYWIIQIPKNISNEIVQEAGEVKIIGDKVIIPKGQYKIEQVSEYLEEEREGKGKYTLLPQIDTGIEGIRYEQKFDSQEKALEEYNSNKEKYSDVQEWEIEDGIIPGEYVLSTRVPADDLHSHTLGRARQKLIGNFTVLDKESQARSGSDYDGDQRFNQVLFRKKGKIIDKGIEGNANNFLLNLVKDYQNPENLERILHPIDVNFFDSIIPKSSIEYTFGDPHGLNDARKKNIIGVTMKGILSDLSTMSALIANHNIGVKKEIIINKDLKTSEFAKDKDGSLRNAIGILLNLAFDNAKDPKIEALGLNEVTANMFILLMITDPKVDTVENKKEFIINKVNTISKYFNSDMLKDFIDLQRESKGVLSDLKNRDIFKKLGEKYDSLSIENLKTLYYSSAELTELKKFYSLTKQFPNNVSELLSIMNTVDDFIQNKTQFLDVKGLMDSDIKTFELIEQSVEFTTNNIFNHTPELSVTGQKIFKKIAERKKKKVFPKSSSRTQFASEKKFDKSISLSNTEIESISRSINLIIAIDAINKNISWEGNNPLSIKELEESLFKNLPNYRNEYKGNKFLNSLQRTSKPGDFSIKLADDYNYSKLSETELNEIRNDFSELPQSLKDKFTLYSFQKYGLGISTFRGNFFNLFDLNHRVDISQLISNEVEKWQQGFISENRIDNIVNWVSLMNKKVIGEISKGEIVQGAQAEKYDINVNPNFELSNEALKEMIDVKSLDQLNAILESEGLSKKLFDKEYLLEKKRNQGKFTVNQFAKELLQKQENQVQFEKPVDIYNLVKKYKPCKF
jgi:hypothetical protein